MIEKIYVTENNYEVITVAHTPFIPSLKVGDCFYIPAKPIWLAAKNGDQVGAYRTVVFDTVAQIVTHIYQKQLCRTDAKTKLLGFSDEVNTICHAYGSNGFNKLCAGKLLKIIDEKIVLARNFYNNQKFDEKYAYSFSVEEIDEKTAKKYEKMFVDNYQEYLDSAYFEKPKKEEEEEDE